MAKVIIGQRAPAFLRSVFRKPRAPVPLPNNTVAVLVAFFITALIPDFAYAMDYSTVTGLFRDFVSWLFIDAGPYLFMAILGVVALGVPKGWFPMKSAVIAVLVAFVFFGIPSIVRYAASSAAAQI